VAQCFCSLTVRSSSGLIEQVQVQDEHDSMLSCLVLVIVLKVCFLNKAPP